MAKIRLSSPRRGPLYTCGASTLAIIWNLYKRVLGLNGPIGSVSRRLAKLGSVVSPLVCVIQYQWLTILSYIDGYLLSIEDKIKKYVPFSGTILNKFDYVVEKIDDLPTGFDHLMDKLSVILEKMKIPFFDTAKEKEIQVDTNFEKKSSKKVGNGRGGLVAMPTMKCSYKEALEKGVNDQESCDEGDEEKKEVRANKKGDPLLDLLDFAWEAPRERLTMARSASYT